jgi:hypothetical protein
MTQISLVPRRYRYIIFLMRVGSFAYCQNFRNSKMLTSEIFKLANVAIAIINDVTCDEINPKINSSKI